MKLLNKSTKQLLQFKYVDGMRVSVESDICELYLVNDDLIDLTSISGAVHDVIATVCKKRINIICILLLIFIFFHQNINSIV